MKRNVEKKLHHGFEKLRKPIAKPSQSHKDNSKYSRKEKHKKAY